MATHPVRMSQISRVQCDYFIGNYDILECKRNARTNYTKHCIEYIMMCFISSCLQATSLSR